MNSNGTFRFLIVIIVIPTGLSFLLLNSDETTTFAQNFTGNITGYWDDSITGTLNATEIGTAEELAKLTSNNSLSDSSSLATLNATIDSTGLEVYVNLYHVGSGSARACVYSAVEDLGCRDVDLSGYSSPVEWGPWQFGPNNVAVGDPFTVCITNLDNGQKWCKYGSNSAGEVPEYLDITVLGQTSSDSTSTSASTSQREEDWSGKCLLVQDYLINQCRTYVNPDGSLTKEGKRAYECISGGVIWSAAGFTGSSLFGIPATPAVIVDGLKIAAGLTGCSGIADFDKIKRSTDPLEILKNLGAGIKN